MVKFNMTIKSNNERKYISHCFSCKHRYFTKWTPETKPKGAQCPACFSFAIVLEEEYKEHIDELHNQLSKEKVESIIKFLSFAEKHDYLINLTSKQPKLERLLEDLLKSY